MCAERNDILDASNAESKTYGLVYTKKAGWIDLGHAQAKGARMLWRQIKSEPQTQGTRYRYFVNYSEEMSTKIIGVGVTDHFWVKRHLTLQEKKSVAMAIYFSVSMDFETFQGQIPLSKTKDSSFSGEDLMSNLIGFYRAVEHIQSVHALFPFL
jgi:hypothetical protein